MSRIAKRFAALKAENRAALVTFIMAGDPDRAACQEVLNGLPAAGADVIELGMPFTDPMADGLAIQLAGSRALAAGGSLKATLAMVAEFRQTDRDTPIILMGYYNPIHAWGPEAFAGDAALAGVDGLIIVDLPPEEAGELVPHLRAAAIDFIVLTTPTSDDARLPVVLANASGFVYYVSIAGVTGTGSATQTDIEAAITRIRRHTDLTVCVGFGIKTPEQAAHIARTAEGAVVGSAIVAVLAEQGPAAALALVGTLAAGVRGARK